MVAVEVGRKQTRKVCNNVRGVTGLGCILSPPLYIKTHSVTVDGCLTEMSFPKHRVCFYINNYAGRAVTTPVS